MTHLKDEDWECLSAYHDGEMSPSEARKFKARLASEAELKSTLLHIREASNGPVSYTHLRAHETYITISDSGVCV